MHAGGLRLTPQRLAILQVLQHNPGHLSPGEVYALARLSAPGLTEATVYRTLEFLAEHELAAAVHVGNGKLNYEAARRPHHHIICQHCGCELELDHQACQPFFEQVEKTSGFRLSLVPLTFFGACPGCQEKKQ